ncbi:CapA family protein [Patescibacteria group bacterium]
MKLKAAAFIISVLIFVSILISGTIILLLPTFSSASSSNTAVQKQVNPNAQVETSQVSVIDVGEEEKVQPAAPTTLLALGDVMLGRYVETLIEKNGNEYPFSNLQSLMHRYDVVLANLEGPIVEGASKTPDESLRFSFRPWVTDILTANNITHTSLANNHLLDYGESGFEETITHLSNSNIIPIGHPREISEQYIVTDAIGDHQIIFIGIQAVSSTSINELTSLVKKVCIHGKLCVVTIHWGGEYGLRSNTTQQNLAHALIDSGADVIIGHHPHVVQEIELYNNSLIYYSLGNTIFDQYFSKDTQEGLLVGIEVTEKNLDFMLYPIRSEKSRPRLMTNEESSIWFEQLSDRSPTVSAESIHKGSISLKLNRECNCGN